MAKDGEMEKIVVKEKEKLLDLASISLNITTYNDIFSSFDPRHYSQRALSQDFLAEIRRAVKERTTGQIDLTFIAPRENRNWESESVIKRRLKEHFKKHYLLTLGDIRKLKVKGIGMALLGVCFIFISTMLYSIENSNLMIKFLQTLLEPAGWFTAWVGLEDIYYNWRELNDDAEFYERMSNAEVEFISI